MNRLIVLWVILLLSPLSALSGEVPSLKDEEVAACFPLSSQELLDKIEGSRENQQKDDWAALTVLLSRSDADSAEQQEGAGDFYELRDAGIAEQCWKAAREHGRPNAGPKWCAIVRHWCNSSSFRRVSYGAAVCLVLAMIILRPLIRDCRERAFLRAESKRSSWWAIPYGCTIFLDASLLQQHSDPSLQGWFEWLARRAKACDWVLRVTQNDYEALLRLSNLGSQDARLVAQVGLNRIKRMKSIAGARVIVGPKPIAMSLVDKVAEGDDHELLFMGPSPDEQRARGFSNGIREKSFRFLEDLRPHPCFKPQS